MRLDSWKTTESELQTLVTDLTAEELHGQLDFLFDCTFRQQIASLTQGMRYLSRD